MKARVIIFVLALLAGTAFAPAPLPKPPRRADTNAVSLANVQGEWRVASFEEITGPNNQRSNVKWFTGIRIKGEQFTYLNSNGADAHAPFQIAIGNKRPAASIDFFQGNKDPVFIGIVRRQGNRFSILYYSASQTRPTSFENIPRNWWLLELER